MVVSGDVDEGPNLLEQGADGETRWAYSDSKARGTIRASGEREETCATAQAVQAEPELRRARSGKGPQRRDGSEPWRAN